MGKKKRKEKLTVFAHVEGEREKSFLSYLIEVYKPEANDINVTREISSGGTPDKIIGKILKECHRDRVFAWLDEDFEPDFPLNKEIRESLAKCWNHSLDIDFLNCPLKNLQEKYNMEKRKPVLIISNPVCCESIILKVLNKKLPFNEYNPAKRKQQIDGLKCKLQQLIGNKEEINYYRTNLNKTILEQKRKEIVELDLLISMITKE